MPTDPVAHHAVHKAGCWVWSTGNSRRWTVDNTWPHLPLPRPPSSPVVVNNTMVISRRPTLGFVQLSVVFPLLLLLTVESVLKHWTANCQILLTNSMATLTNADKYREYTINSNKQTVDLPLGVCCHHVPSVLWRCWLGGRKGIWPVKNWVVGCWHGYLSGARCIFAYRSADALPLTVSCSSKSRLVLPEWFCFSGAGLSGLSWKKGH